ncbi:MAG: hypothetical protein Ta2D_05270 [Rickettsiales bacterium]|nr:MAG: hypothetical protein Ta2D_05270 [Rickettsiales bacterium]
MLSLFDAFNTIKSEQEFDNFLNDLCTPQELKDFKDRWIIAQYLFNGNTQREISKEVKCSITTVTRVARFLDKERYRGYKGVLEKLVGNGKGDKE